VAEPVEAQKTKCNRRLTRIDINDTFVVPPTP